MEHIQHREKQHEWDAVVVGSGVGGLVCAAYLAVSGLRVLVLEQHDVAGGNSHVFRRRRRYEFDVGVHYLGDCGPGGVIPSVFGALGIDGERLSYRPMDQDGFDRIVVPGVQLDVPAGWPGYRRRLKEALPGEDRQLDAFADICAAVGAEGRAAMLLDGTVTDAGLAARCPATTRWADRTLAQLFDHCGLSRRARTVLAAIAPTYALPPDEVSVPTHAAIVEHYLKGAYYPAGGGQMLPAGLVEVIEAHGGEVRTRCRAERILVDGGRVTGVGLADGTVARAPQVISNADYTRTVRDLTGERHFAADVVERTRDSTMSLPYAVLYVALDRELPRRNANLWWYRHEDIDEGFAQLARGDMDPLPFLFASFSSLKDPAARNIAPPGHANFQVMTLCPPGHAYWGLEHGPAAGERYRRNDRYRQRKDALTASLLDAAEEALGPFRDHVTHLETATPITHERYVLSTGGTPYGLARWGGVGERPGLDTCVTGLHVVGTNTLYGSGIEGVAVGGVACASRVLGRPLLPYVLRGGVLGDPGRLPPRDADFDALAVSRGADRRGARGLARTGR